MSLRVLFLLPDLSGGGAERVTLELLNGLQGKAQAELYLLQNQGPFLSQLPTQVRVISKPRSGWWGRLVSVAQYIGEARQCDVLVGSLEITANLVAALCGWLVRKPTVVWVHKDLRYFLEGSSLLKSKLYYLLTWLTFRIASHIVLVSDGARSSAIELFPFIEVKSSRIHNPVDIQKILQESQKPPQIALPPQPFLLAVGRLEWQKGFDLLLKALALLKARGEAYRLVILGEGSLRPQLEALKRELELDSQVWLPGFTNPFPIFRAANVFVLSSRYEGLGMVMLEAMALDTPVVAFDCPAGPRELSRGGELAYLAKPENIEDLAAGIHQVMQAGTAPAERVRAWVEQFDTKKIAELWYGLLESVALGKTSSL